MLISIIFYLIFFLFSLAQAGRISLNNGQVNFYLYEMLMVPFFGYLLYKVKLEPIKKGFKKFKIIYFFLLFLLFSYFLNFFNFKLQENLIAFLYFIRLNFYSIFFLYLNFFLKKEPRYKKTLLIGFYLFAGLTVLISFGQFILYPDLRNLYYLGWDPHLNRMFGLVFDTSTAAAVYGLIFLYLYRSKKILLSMFPLLCLILTFSRSAYIVILLVILFDIFSRKNYKYGFLILVLFAVIFWLSPKKFGVGVNLTRIFSINARVTDYKQALSIWKKYPLFGVGYNRIRYIKEKAGILSQKVNLPTHSSASFSSSYLIILVGGGAIGLVLFLASLFKIISINKKFFIYVLFVAVLSLADNIILHPYILFLLGVINLFDS